MTNYNKHEPEFKEKILRLHPEDGRTKKSLTEEYRLDQDSENILANMVNP